jgi:YHS domain-containing protein
MNIRRTSILWCFALVIVISLSGAGFAQHADHQHDGQAASGKFLGKGDGVTTCAVTGEELHNKNIHGEFFGRTVYFCCPGCLEKAQKNPELYVRSSADAKPAAATQSEKKFLGKGDGIDTCPVTGEAVDKTLKGEVNGRTFYVCCAGCLDTVKKNPELYLKPEKKSDHEAHTAGDGKFLGKGDGIETCPVTGEAISKDVKAVINGRTVYACCPGCIEKVKQHPDLYLKKN